MAKHNFYGKTYYYYHGTENFIQNPYRENANPVFLELAKTAARNSAGFRWGGKQGLNFVKPTSHPLGYFAVLGFIARNPNLNRAQIYKHFNAKIVTTLERLTAGGLVEVIHNSKPMRWAITDLGEAYLKAGAEYQVKRAQPIRRR